MFVKLRTKPVAWGLVVSLILFLSPSFLQSQNRDAGRIEGQIFAKDGTTPYRGAVVTVKNVSTGEELKSGSTDANGRFRIDGVPKGVYVFGVLTPDGNFNSENLIGVEPGKTAKISIALTTFDDKTRIAAQEIYEDQSKHGEALVGKVITFDRATKTAMVFLLRGFVKIEDRLHVKGEETDFYQDLEALQVDGIDIRQAFAGQTAAMLFKYDALPGDLVYVICKKGGFPLFLFPIGIAAIVAGAGAIITTETDETNEVSTFRIKK